MARDMESTFGFSVPVALLTLPELRKVHECPPFPVDALRDGEQVHVSFLIDSPSEEAVKGLEAVEPGLDECRIANGHAYVLYRQPVHKSSLSNQWIERRLGVPATLRNWKTVSKLLELGNDLLEHGSVR